MLTMKVVFELILPMVRGVVEVPGVLKISPFMPSGPVTPVLPLDPGEPVGPLSPFFPGGPVGPSRLSM